MLLHCEEVQIREYGGLHQAQVELTQPQINPAINDTERLNLQPTLFYDFDDMACLPRTATENAQFSE